MSMLSFKGEIGSCTIVFLSGYLSSGVVFSKLLVNVCCIHTQILLPDFNIHWWPKATELKQINEKLRKRFQERGELEEMSICCSPSISNLLGI